MNACIPAFCLCACLAGCGGHESKPSIVVDPEVACRTVQPAARGAGARGFLVRQYLASGAAAGSHACGVDPAGMLAVIVPDQELACGGQVGLYAQARAFG